ncbi:LemA protein [bacterium A37T11]|nr:LemA protein [bacterium A37T11]
MKRILFGVICLFAVASLSSCSYNTLVKLDENVKSSWAQVENAYQRRADLIPNLVNTVKGAADFEKGTLTAVIEARAKATSTTIDPSNLTPEAIEKFQASQDGLSQSLSKLMVVVEKYPDLKANQNFRDLQVQLEGTENRISTERRAFNEATQEFNAKLRSFPTNITAGWFGFKEKGYFKAAAGSDKAPTVAF